RPRSQRLRTIGSRWRNRSNGCDPFSTQAFGATAGRVEWSVASRGAAAANPGGKKRPARQCRGGDQYPNQQEDCSMESDDGRLIARFQTLDDRASGPETIGAVASRVGRRALSDVARARTARPQANSRLPERPIAGG